MNKTLPVILMFLLSLPSFGQKLSIGQEVTMLALGDSYTIGQGVDTQERWPHQFVDRLRTLGISVEYPDYIARTGWTTRNLLQGIENNLEKEKGYNLVSILIGVNNQYQGSPIEGYEPDLRKIINTALGLVDQDASRVLILSIPDYAYTPFGQGFARISEEIDAYNLIKRNVAEEYGIVFIDITPISREGLDNPGLLASDALHPSGEQYGRWVEAIIPSAQIEVSLSSNDLQDIKNDPIRVYPNPAGSNLKIEADVDMHRIQIYNARGSIVYDNMLNGLELQIDLGSFEPGIYSLWIRSESSGASYKKSIILN